MSQGSASRVTRSSLVRLSRRLEQVHKGAALLQNKRDALVSQLFARVRPTIDARQRIEQQAAHAYRALALALAAAGRDDLAALAWPSREVHAAEAGVSAPTLVRSAVARAALPGQHEPAALQAAQAFEKLLDAVLAAAPEEFAMRKLGRALAHTVRQVNVLEQRVAPGLARALVHVRRTLDEREREESVRLRRIAARSRGGSR